MLLDAIKVGLSSGSQTHLRTASVLFCNCCICPWHIVFNVGGLQCNVWLGMGNWGGVP